RKAIADLSFEEWITHIERRDVIGVLRLLKEKSTYWRISKSTVSNHFYATIFPCAGDLILDWRKK
ncbi:MAG TPA: hypothetical protein VER14_07350, partial [Phototrophicaceae bacterium]|nr:hypothetical protein [Phototrophicaceae bacterium]